MDFIRDIKRENCNNHILHERIFIVSLVAEVKGHIVRRRDNLLLYYEIRLEVPVCKRVR